LDLSFKDINEFLNLFFGLTEYTFDASDNHFVSLNKLLNFEPVPTLLPVVSCSFKLDVTTELLRQTENFEDQYVFFENSFGVLTFIYEQVFVFIFC
jgi:hypothetical protein